MADIVEMPKLGFDMAEGKLVKWVKAEKDPVEKGDVLAEIETDKATVEVESSFSGIVYKHLVDEGTTLPVGDPIAVIAEENEDVDIEKLIGMSEGGEEKNKSAKEETKVVEEKVEKAPAKKEEKVEIEAKVKEEEGEEFLKASPIAKRMAEEQNLDLESIEGTGPGGRIVKRDIEKVMEEGAPLKKATPTETEKHVEPKELEKSQIVSGEDQTLEINKLRSAIGKRMLESHQTIPDFTITYTYNAASLMQMREGINRELYEDQKLSVNDFIIRAVALALQEFPNLNSSLEGSKLTRHGNINIGSAVAVDNGLLTVVVMNADQKPLSVISGEMKGKISRVKDGKVRNDDIEGSTFTISNLGMFGTDEFTAIINPPEAAILAVGGALQVPVIQNGQIIIGWQMKATLSADHRITDGAEAARFMQHLATYLEQPWRLVQ